MMKKLRMVVLGLSFVGALAIGLNSDSKAFAYGDYPAPQLLHGDHGGAPAYNKGDGGAPSNLHGDYPAPQEI
ncbi:Phr family secreted Rap phosphatase inhibitor [Bacillus pseudomycoides]|uniref:Phr family secreted Rap phosphatase inhibitor n=1 Tax=Bacillus bingmayongensis TaxID=1150157 RepID=A0ABU5JRZ4_9BACI|nr:Phr family secreted Rap phosphatase inhibitor [Bacillus pseudomycoides]